MKAFVIALLFVTTLAVAQNASEKPADKPVPVPPNPTAISTGLPFIAMDQEGSLKFRNFERKANQLEIEISQLKVKIKEDEAAEAAIWRDAQVFVAGYAKDKAIDVTKFDFDAGDLHFVFKPKKP